MGDGTQRRLLLILITYKMNELAKTTQNPEAKNTVFTAFGDRNHSNLNW
jgi:hypothetical protein